MTSLNPVLRIARQLVETMAAHGRFTTGGRTRPRRSSLLGRMGITAPERAVAAIPHQFSGGMRQRVMLAMGFSNEPSLLIADEPTTALDVTIQAQILDLLRELNARFRHRDHPDQPRPRRDRQCLLARAGDVRRRGGGGRLARGPADRSAPSLHLGAAQCRAAARPPRRRRPAADHDRGPAARPARLADRAAASRARCPFAHREMRASIPQLLPIGAGTRGALLGDAGGRHAARAADRARARGRRQQPRRCRARRRRCSQVRGLAKHFPLPTRGLLRAAARAARRRWRRPRRCFAGETVGLVGESGCGKSTLARLVTRLHEPTAGTIVLRRPGHRRTPRQSAIRPLRRRMQMIFQDPYASLNPRMTVGDILGEPAALPRHRRRTRRHARTRVAGAARRRRPAARSRRALPARILRRPAAAHLDRPRAGGAARLHRRRRADLGARRQHPGADHQPDGRPAGAASASPTCSSRTTSPWCGTSATASSVLYLGKVMEVAPADGAVLARRCIPTRAR